jgi:hypothetical protein
VRPKACNTQWKRLAISSTLTPKRKKSTAQQARRPLRAPGSLLDYAPSGQDAVAKDPVQIADQLKTIPHVLPLAVIDFAALQLLRKRRTAPVEPRNPKR